MISSLLRFLSLVGLVVAPAIFLDTLAKATLLLVLALLSCAAMRRGSAASKHYLLGLTMAGLCLIPILSAFGPQLRVLPASWTLVLREQPPTNLNAPSSETMALSPVNQADTPAPFSPENSATSSDAPLLTTDPAVLVQKEPSNAFLQQTDSNEETTRSWLPIVWQSLAALWLLGCMVMLARLALAMLRLRRTEGRAKAIDGAAWLALAQQLGKSLGTSRRMQLVVSDQATMPMTWGVWRPNILLPADCDAWSDERKRVVLLHELAHIQRYDSAWLALTEVVRALYWFHPLVWFGARQMTAYRERACDDRVLSAGHVGTVYAEHLLHIAAQNANAMPPCSAAIAMARANQLESRIRLILDAARNRADLSRKLAGGLALLMAVIVIPLALLRAAEPANTDDSASRPSLEELLKTFAKHEQAYLPYHLKSLHTLRMADGITQEQRERYPWADGRKHQRRMEYGQVDSTNWMRKEMAVYDGQESSRHFDRYCDGKRLLNVDLDESRRPRVQEVTNPEEIQRLSYIEPLLGIFPLSAFSSGDLLSSVISRGEVDVALDWDGKDARLSFEYGSTGIRTRFVIWLSHAHDWHPIKLERRFVNSIGPFFSDWKVTKFAHDEKNPRGWRVAAGTLSYNDNGETAKVLPRTDDVIYFDDFEVLTAKYGQDVPKELAEYEIPNDAEIESGATNPSAAELSAIDTLEPQLISNRFVVCPVATDLQRQLLSHTSDTPSRASVCLLVNAAAFPSLDEIHDKNDGLSELRDSLSKLLEQSDSREASAHLIDPMNGDFTFDQREQRMEKLDKLLTKTCKQAGFQQVRVSHTFGVQGPGGHDFQWTKYIGQAQQATRGRDPSRERIVDIGHVRVSSVQTFLARRLSDADCIVDIVPIVRDVDGARFVEDVLPIVKTAVENIHRTGGDKLLIRLRYSQTAQQDIEQWDNPQKKEFAQELGFQRISVSQSAIAQSEEEVAAPAEDRPREYTYPLSVSGRALNEQGEPIVGAKIFLAAYRPGSERLAETTTNTQGDYRFENVPLLIERADTNQRRDSGGFEVFGIADGYALSWRPTKDLDPTRTVVSDTSPSQPPQDRKTTYGREESIALDLTFDKPTGFRGRIVDDLGEPLPNANIAIRGCDTERKQWNRDHTNYKLIRDSGLNSLNERAIVPTEVKTRVSDEDGQFEFTGLPANYRWQLDVQPEGYSPRTVAVVTGESEFEALDDSKSYRGDFELVFARPRQVTFRVVYSDTGRPAQGVGVGAAVTQAGFWETTNENGRVTARLADGTYDLFISPRIGTPYLESKQQVIVSEEGVREPIEVQLNPAAVLEIEVLDADTDQPLDGVDVWWDDTLRNGQPNREVRWWRSWEAETGISHAEKPRTDANGKMRVLFPPGKHRIGVAKEAFPAGYEPVDDDGKEIEMKAGEPVEVKFRLQRAVQLQ